MLDEYVEMCERTFAAIGVDFTAEQSAHLRSVLEGQLIEAYSASQRSDIVITYDSPVGHVVNYHVRAQWASVAHAYDNWVATREPPYFGSQPDARVQAIIAEAENPASSRVLDIGAGTGRNSLAIARRGHPVDAMEMAGEFAEMIRTAAADEALDITVLQRDMFAAADDLRRDYWLIVLSEVVSDFRTLAELRAVFELAADCLKPGGCLVFNPFLAREDFQPDDAARQYAQQAYSTIFTYADLAAASKGLPLELISDISVYDYEKAHLPAEEWPPTNWYPNWVSGLDIFAINREQSPVELRWLVYRKTH